MPTYQWGSYAAGGGVASGDEHIYSSGYTLPAANVAYDPVTKTNAFRPMKITGLQVSIWNTYGLDVDVHYATGPDVEGTQTTANFTPNKSGANDVRWVYGLSEWHKDTATAEQLLIHVYSDGIHTIDVQTDNKNLSGTTTSTGANSVHPFSSSYSGRIPFAIDYVTAPTAVTGVSAVAQATSGAVKVFFNLPTDRGGLGSTSYIFERFRSGATTPENTQTILQPYPELTAEGDLGWSITQTGLTPGVGYFYRVFSTNEVTDHYSLRSPYATTNTVTAPGAPQGSPTFTTAVDTSTEKAVVVSVTGGITNWGSPYNNVPTYNIYRNGTKVQTVTGTATTTSPLRWTDTGLTIGTSYTYTVKAANTTYESTSNTVPAVVGAGYASQPYNFTATQGTTPGRINLSWTVPANATTYHVYNGNTLLSSTSMPAVSTVTVSGTTATANLTNAVVGTTYSISIAARNAWMDANNIAENNTKNQTAAVNQMAPGTPTVPTAFTATGSTSVYGRADITWGDPTTTAGTLTQYNVYLDGTASANLFTSFSAAITPKTGNIVGLPVGSHTLTIAARNQWTDAAGNTYTLATFTPARTIAIAAKPTPPLNAIATPDPTISGTIHLTWSAPTSINGTFARYSVHTATGDLIGYTTNTTYDITGAEPGIAYTYYIKAWNTVSVQNDTPSDNSGPASVTAKGEALAPGNVVVVRDAIVPRRLVVSWSPPTGTIVSYNIYRNDVFQKNIKAPIIEYRDDLLTPGVTYTYKLAAINNTGVEGQFSTSISNSPINFAKPVGNLSVVNASNQRITGGPYQIASSSANQITFYRDQPNIPPAGAIGGTATDETNASISGAYHIHDTPTEDTFRYRQPDLNPFPATDVQSSSVTNVTNTRINGNQTIETVTPGDLKFTYIVPIAPENVDSDVTNSKVVDNSNKQFTVDSVKIIATTNDTFSYPSTSTDTVALSGASGAVHNFTNDNLYNGEFTVTVPTGSHNTLSYNIVAPNMAESLNNSAKNPSFEYPGTAYTLRSNLVTNPSFEIDFVGTGWTPGANITATRTTSDSLIGGVYSILLTKNTLAGTGSNAGYGLTYQATNLTVGAVYTFSAYLKAASGDASPYLAGDQLSQNPPLAATGAWVRRYYTFTAAATTHYLSIETGAATIPNSSILVDHVMLEAGSVASSYFDGGTLGDTDFTYSWAGVPHNSTALQTAIRANGVDHQNDSGGTYYAKSYRTNNAAGVKDGNYALAMVNRGTVPANQFINLKNTLSLTNNTVYTLFATITTTEEVRQKALPTDPDQIYFGISGGSGEVAIPTNIFGAPDTYDIIVKFTTPATYTGASGYFRLYNAKNSVNSILYVDKLMVLSGDQTPATKKYTVPYFNGATPDTEVTVYDWTGEAHNSTTSRTSVAGSFVQTDAVVGAPYGDVARSDMPGSVQVIYRSGWLG